MLHWTTLAQIAAAASTGGVVLNIALLLDDAAERQTSKVLQEVVCGLIVAAFGCAMLYACEVRHFGGYIGLGFGLGFTGKYGATLLRGGSRTSLRHGLKAILTYFLNRIPTDDNGKLG